MDFQPSGKLAVRALDLQLGLLHLGRELSTGLYMEAAGAQQQSGQNPVQVANFIIILVYITYLMRGFGTCSPDHDIQQPVRDVDNLADCLSPMCRWTLCSAVAAANALFFSQPG